MLSHWADVLYRTNEEDSEANNNNLRGQQRVWVEGGEETECRELDDGNKNNNNQEE